MVVEYRIVEDKGNVISLNNMNLVFVKNNGVYVGTDITRYPFKIIHDELNIKKCIIFIVIHLIEDKRNSISYVVDNDVDSVNDLSTENKI